MSRLAQIHRGRASVEDLSHGGAAFKVSLPHVSETTETVPSGRTTEGGARPTLEDGAIAI